MKVLQYFILVVFTAFIVACGGGGGGSGNTTGGGTGNAQSNNSQASTNNSFTLSFTKAKAATSCYIQSNCAADIRANYVGKSPAKAFVFITIDSQLIKVNWSINETYTDLFFSGFNLLAGEYKGVAAIEICGDENCNVRYGSRYNIPYEFTVMSYSPEFTTSLVGKSAGVVSRNDILIDNFSGNNDKYELTISMPETATEVIMPDEFIKSYKVEKISETHFYITPPITFSSPTYSLKFTGPNNYSKLFDVTVRTNNSVLSKDIAPLPYQVFAIESNSPEIKSIYSESSFNGKYYGNAGLIQTINYINGSGWAKNATNLWNLGFIILPPTEYGIFEATINLTYENKVFSYPLVLANTKEYKQTWASERTEITPSKTINTANFQHIWDNCVIEICVFDIFTARPISKWIKNVKYTHTLDRSNYYSYEIDLEKLSEVDPSSGEIPAGVIALSSTNASNNYSLATIKIDVKIPSVYYASVKKVKENTPFEQSINGNLYYFEGVEIVKLEQDTNGQYTKEGNKFFHHVNSPNLPTESLTFNMPSLAKGKYKLNFSGIFSKHFPEFLLDVE